MKFIDTISAFLYNILIHRHDIDMEERSRRRIYIILNSLAIPLVVIFGYEKLQHEEYLFGITDLMLAGLLTGLVIYLRRMKEGRKLFRIAVFFMSSAAIYWLYSGVNDGSSSLWYLVIPSVAFFLFGKREGLAWAASLLIISIIVFASVRLSGPPFQYTVPFMTRHLVIQLLIILLTFSYESVRTMYKNKMEEKQVRLLSERNSLDRANSMLMAEIEERERIEEELHTHKDHLEELVSQRTDQLAASLKEKEVLLKELYHRTKNNMQVISSMISLIASKPGNEAFADICRELDLKIKSMALVHQKLYESMDLTHINIKEYLEALSQYILNTLHVSGGAVSFRFQGDDASLSIDVAIPFGLVLNELMTNSIKHAFRGGSDNRIELDIVSTDDGLKLKYRDNGVGLPPDFDSNDQNAMGMMIMRNIIEMQLGGKMLVLNSKGFSCEISIKTGLYRKRV
ncbi:MAG: sensor histidine kinase [Spirochaetes bacterium]|nr:sensor histidine kinase [Spirochaetota bacterium]